MRAIVYGLRKWTDGDGTHTAPGEGYEAELIRRIGSSTSDVWLCRFDGEAETYCRNVRKYL